MKTTLPSKKVPHRVFEEHEVYLLEVKNKNHYALYEINCAGEEKFLSTSPYPYQADEEEIENLLDALSGEILRKIDILTTRYEYQGIQAKLQVVLENIKKPNYSVTNFSMEDSYVFEDYKEVLEQLFRLTKEPQYQEHLNKISKFFDENFYERRTEYSADEKIKVEAQILTEIIFLSQLSE